MALKDRVLTKFPAIVNASTGIAVSIANGVYEFFLNFTSFLEISVVPDITTAKVLVYTPDPTDPTINGVFNLMSLSNLIASGSAKVQLVTAGNATIQNDANIVLVNQTTPGPTTLTLPLAVSKSGQVLVVDWKGDAATNLITINPSGPETYQGGLTSWKLEGNGASISFKPVANVGYAI